MRPKHYLVIGFIAGFCLYHVTGGCEQKNVFKDDAPPQLGKASTKRMLDEENSWDAFTMAKDTSRPREERLRLLAKCLRHAKKELGDIEQFFRDEMGDSVQRDAYTMLIKQASALEKELMENK